ncbi:MAG: tRNA (adenosine(37)-N6)-threonylcarbamoyltransferase complex dimerization subunit type 1 TsaB [Candidatus Omnitrophota bacterium]
MKILAIDTSTKFLSLALAEDDKIISVFHRDMERERCSRLIPEIDKILRKAKLKLKDIGCIIFSKGPGSFTGLRIGAATVKGLTFGSKIKIVGVPSLDILAFNIRREVSFIVPIIDARRGNVYASIYSFQKEKLKRHMRYSVLPVGELLKDIKGDSVFLGDGLIPYGKTIESDFKYKAYFAGEKDWYPKASAAVTLGLALIKKKKFEDPDKFVPMYLYPKDIQCRRRIV